MSITIKGQLPKQYNVPYLPCIICCVDNEKWSFHLTDQILWEETLHRTKRSSQTTTLWMVSFRFAIASWENVLPKLDRDGLCRYEAGCSSHSETLLYHCISSLLFVHQTHQLCVLTETNHSITVYLIKRVWWINKLTCPRTSLRHSSTWLWWNQGTSPWTHRSVG